MLDSVLTIMSTFIEEPLSIEAKLTGLTSHLDDPSCAQKATDHKSCSCKHSKRRGQPEDEDTPSFASPAQTAVKGKTEEAFLKTFPDTAVLVKSAATPFLTKNKEEVLI